jgi:hypothetical protein
MQEHSSPRSERLAVHGPMSLRGEGQCWRLSHSCVYPTLVTRESFYRHAVKFLMSKKRDGPGRGGRGRQRRDAQRRIPGTSRHSCEHGRHISWRQNGVCHLNFLSIAATTRLAAHGYDKNLLTFQRSRGSVYEFLKARRYFPLVSCGSGTEQPTPDF